jgi:hypothetical protein
MQTSELVLRHVPGSEDSSTLEPFLRELGWEPKGEAQ